jgi:DNA processing protein
VSEFSLAAVAKPEHFPRRNRIISGLSLGTLVVEAALQSGSLITANYALEQGREVFAIPGSIHNPMARGCHRLLRDGAKLVETVPSIVEELGVLAKIDQTSISPKSVVPLEQGYAELLNYIDYTPTSIDLLVERSGLGVAEVASITLILELQGYIEASSLGYCRK